MKKQKIKIKLLGLGDNYGKALYGTLLSIGYGTAMVKYKPLIDNPDKFFVAEEFDLQTGLACRLEYNSWQINFDSMIFQEAGSNRFHGQRKVANLFEPES